MKYDFIDPINKHLKVKINGSLSPNNWITGASEAAKGCQSLALHMALEVLIRHCISQGSDINLDDAIKVLCKMGFDEQNIREEAKDSSFSIFYLTSPDSGNQ